MTASFHTDAARSTALSVVLAWGSAVAAVAGTPVVVQNHQSGLRTVEVGPGALPIILLHGYGSAPEQWLPFDGTIHVSGAYRFIFPEGTSTTTPPDGPVGGRAWWRLDLGSYRRGKALPDLSHARPKGLDDASRTTKLLLKDVSARLGSARSSVILGGFSQGAMIAADVAFRSEEPLRALVLFSGTFVDEPSWTAGMPRRKGLPVFIAHGRRDDVLPFGAARRLAERMRAAGLKVTWVPFDGGHEIPASAVTALNAFLVGVGAGPTAP